MIARGGPGADVGAKADAVADAWDAGLRPGAVVCDDRSDTDDEVVGFALFGPPARYAPRASSAPPPDPAALLLATVYVEPAWREQGIGRLLLHAALREAIRQDRRAVEAFGDRRHLERSCLLPVEWLLHEGFEVHREHVRTPLLRMDVRRLLRWAETLEEALDEVLARLPRRAPAAPGWSSGREASTIGR